MNFHNKNFIIWQRASLLLLPSFSAFADVHLSRSVRVEQMFCSIRIHPTRISHGQKPNQFESHVQIRDRRLGSTRRPPHDAKRSEVSHVGIGDGGPGLIKSKGGVRKSGGADPTAPCPVERCHSPLKPVARIRVAHLMAIRIVQHATVSFNFRHRCPCLTLTR